MAQYKCQKGKFVENSYFVEMFFTADVLRSNGQKSWSQGHTQNCL